VIDMIVFNRQSPVEFKSKPVKTDMRDHWEVVLEYDNEGPGPWVVDLSHKTRWDLQNGRLDALKPVGLTIPQAPGDCQFENGTLVSRMNRTQAAVWQLGHGALPEPPVGDAMTNVSEATVVLALIGPGVFPIAEKLSSLDFMDPERQPPFLLQGPFSHVPCQIVTMTRGGAGVDGALLLACSRGYARDMVDAILDAGSEFGLCPAGEIAFERYLEKSETTNSSSMKTTA
jgi:hypothetical protein